MTPRLTKQHHTTHLHIIIFVLQAILQAWEELVRVNNALREVQDPVHAGERCLAQAETIINFALERSIVNLTDQVLAWNHFKVQYIHQTCCGALLTAQQKE